MLPMACWLGCGLAFPAPPAVGTEARRFEVAANAERLAASPDASRLLVYGQGAAVWAADGKLVARLESGPGSHNPVVGFSADGGRVCLAEQGVHMSWDAAIGKRLPTQMTVEDEFAWRLIAVAWRWLTPRRLPGEDDAAYRQRNPGLGLGLAFVGLYLHPFHVNTVAVTPDGRRALLTFQAGHPFDPASLLSLRVWDADRGGEAWRFTSAAWTRRLYDCCVRLDPAAEALLAFAARAQQRLPAAWAFDLSRTDNRSVCFRWAADRLDRFADRLRMADLFALGCLRSGEAGGGPPGLLSPDGRYLAAFVGDRRILVWDIATGRPVRALPTSEWPEQIAFDPAGATLVTAGRPAGQLEYGACVLTRLDIATGRKLWTATALHGELRSVTFSPDGKLALVVGKYQGVWLWDAEAGKLLGRVGSAGYAAPTDAAFLGDGRRVATITPAGEKASLVQVWRLPGR